MRLVALTSAKRESKAVIEATLGEATTHPPVFPYLGGALAAAASSLFEVQGRLAIDEEPEA